MIQLISMFSILLIATAALEAKPLPQASSPAGKTKNQNDSEEANASRKLEDSAKRGDPVAMYQFSKRGHPEEVRMEWLKRAASKEYGPAILELALEEEVHSSNRSLSKEVRESHLRTYHVEIKRAFDGLHACAKAGDIESMYRIGAYSRTYAKEGLASERECLTWLEKAALRGHVEAPFSLALALIEMDTAVEKAKGFEWLKKSTKTGVYRARAAVELARYYTYGFPEIELKRNAKEAWKWAKKGAELQEISIGEFLVENGLEDPDKVKPGVILFQ